MEHKKPIKKGLKILIIVVSIILAVILAFGATFTLLKIIGKKQFHLNDTGISVSSPDIVVDENEVFYNNKKYTLNENIFSVLFMGIDKNDVNSDLGFGLNGQADTLFLAAVDTDKKSFKIIPISRETMVDVNLYNTSGLYTGTEKMQLCLAYAYGDTPENCSENVITSVKRLLLGINIGAYVTVDMQGLKAITEKIGGIEVIGIEDIMLNGVQTKSGDRLTLSGSNILQYIRTRGSDSDANNRRMQRQKQVLSALVSKAGNQILKNFGNLTLYYNTLIPYISTNMSFSQITYLASNCLVSDMGNKLEYISITGSSYEGEKWTEFHPNDESVLSAVIETFYIEKQT